MNDRQQARQMLDDRLRSADDYLREHGRLRWGRNLPIRWHAERASKPRACFERSAVGVLRFPNELSYTEGLAISRCSPTDNLLVAEHAWLTDLDGEVVDLAWVGGVTAQPGVAYFGVTVPTRVFHIARCIVRYGPLRSVLSTLMDDDE